MGIFGFLFKGKAKKEEAIKTALENQAIIVDVRTVEEFRSGHVKGAMNIPLHNLEAQSAKLAAKGKTIITCCRSGMRSKNAEAILKSKGIDAINGGGWNSLQALINS